MLSRPSSPLTWQGSRFGLIIFPLILASFNASFPKIILHTFFFCFITHSYSPLQGWILPYCWQLGSSSFATGHFIVTLLYFLLYLLYSSSDAPQSRFFLWTATSFSAQGYLGYGKGMPYAPGFMILGQEGDNDVTQLYHEGSDGKSYSIVYINLDLNVRNRGNRGNCDCDY